jgi:hypothetical protein
MKTLEEATVEVKEQGLKELLRKNEEFQVALKEAQYEAALLKDAMRDLLRAYDMLFPGIKFISVPDYQLINEAPLNARKLV